MKSEEYQSRYVAYASAHGNIPPEQLKHDSVNWPGGKMAGYLIWITQMWRTWADEAGEVAQYGDAWSPSQHTAFDAWLTQKTKKGEAS